MKRVTAYCLVMCAFLAGCTSTDALYVEPLAPAAPVGEAQLTGQVPKFKANPTGATTQLTAAEKSEIRADLEASAAPASVQAAVDNRADYKAGVIKLRKEGDALLKERLKRIQGDTEAETID